MIKLTKVDGGYTVAHENGCPMGEIDPSGDGFYVWWPSPSNGGFLSEGVLECIVNELKKLNAPIEKEYNDWFLENN